MTTTKLLNFYQKNQFFLFPFFLVLALGFYVDLQVLLGEFQELKAQERIRTSLLEEKEKAFQQAGPVSARLRARSLEKVKKPLLVQVIQAAEINLCKLVGLQTEFKSSETQVATSQTVPLLNNRLIIKLHLYGAYISFYRFIETLIQQGLPLRLDHFSLKDQGDFVDLNVQFSAFPGALALTGKTALTQSKRSSCCVRDPFQEAGAFSPEQSFVRQEVLQDLSLEQLRYVGYLRQAGKIAALLVFPDGQIYDLYPGSSLGKGAWQVLSINSQRVTLQDQRQKKLLSLMRT